MKKILYRYNAMNVDSICGFGSIRGGLNADCRDVYFIRLLGISAGMADEIRRLDGQMDQYMGQGHLFYRRMERLPLLSSAGETQDYVKCYQKWIDGEKKSIEIKAAHGNPALQESLSRACEKTLELYIKTKNGVTDSMVKNYWVKLMYWFDAVFEGNLSNWEAKSSIKIVLQDVWKEQEYLFCYMATLIGADVLLLESERDIALCEELQQLSKSEQIGSFGRAEIPPYVRAAETMEPQMKEALSREAAQPQENLSQSAGMQQAQENSENFAGSQQGQNIRITMPPRPSKKLQTPHENSNRSAMQPPQSNTESAAALPRSRATGVISAAKKPPRSANVGARQEKSFEQLALLASSIVMIAIHDAKGDIIGTGSGIMIGRDGYILTNNHVASGGRYYSIRIEDDDQVYTTDEVIKYNSVLDLAVIRLQRTLSPLPIYQGNQKLVRGQKVVAIGSPLGLFNSVSDGIISGFRVIDHVDMIQFTAPTSHGSSGGAVLNMYGEVIGISTAGFDDGQNINLAVGYESINMFIKGFVS